MEGVEHSLPTVEEFTDYSQWERRPSNRPGGICSVGRGRAGERKHQPGRHDPLLLAARLSHGSVLVDCAPQQVAFSHCHSNTKKHSSYSPPRQTTRSRSGPGKKVSSVTSPKQSLLQVGSSTALISFGHATYIYTCMCGYCRCR